MHYPSARIALYNEVNDSYISSYWWISAFPGIQKNENKMFLPMFCHFNAKNKI